MKKISVFLCCLFLFCVIVPVEPKNKNNSQNEIQKAIVRIKITTTAILKEESEEILLTKEEEGTGFIVNLDGWIMTNFHVIESLILDSDEIEGEITGQKMEIALSDGRICGKSEKDLIKCCLEKDVALFKIDCPVKNLPFLRISESQPQIGDKITILGLKEKRSGIIISTFGLDNNILVNIPFENGWSGSPVLLDKEKKVIGMATFFYFESGGKIVRYAIVPVKIFAEKFFLKDAKSGF